MRALTLYPEHAEAFRLRLRSIETRAKPTRYRGPLLLHAGMRDPDSPAARKSPRSQAALAAIPHGNGLTRGAVVASCQIVGCVPMVHAGEEGAVRTLDIDDNGSLWIVEPQTDEEAEDGPPEWREVTDQLPFGDFTPGRYAWLLDDVKPTTERCPRCWGEVEMRDGPGRKRWTTCSTCRGGVCAPVPMRGKQGLWTPTW